MSRGRRAFGIAALCFVLAGCGTQPPGTAATSGLSYDRTFAIALAAMADQKMIFSVQDRRHGNIVAALHGDTITATVQPHFDGTIRVSFAQQGQADPGLLQRVVDAYNARLSGAAHLLPGASK